MNTPRTWSASLVGSNESTQPDPARSAVALLALPGPQFLATGGDERLILREGRNAYGMPLADLDPLVRGSSCTATPPDRVAMAAADAWRRDLLADIARAGRLPSHRSLRASVVDQLLRTLGMPDTEGHRVVLAASGTEVETITTALTLAGSERRVRNVLVGALEAGSGTVLAAAGRYFSGHTPFRAGAPVGDSLPGFATDRITLVDVELRDAHGRPRRPFDVEAEVEAHLEDAVECRDRVLVHVMAGSKTGLRHMDPAWVRSWRRRFPDELRVVVDAAQARVSPAELRAYLDAGAAISLTGSKAICGPPFCGALVLDDALLADARTALLAGLTLPAGLREMLSAADLPAELLPLLPRAEPANLPLLARWAVAFKEADHLAAFPRADRDAFVEELVTRIAVGLDKLPRVRTLPLPGPAPTIVSFAILDAAGEGHTKPVLSEIYDALVAFPGVQFGQPVELSPRGPAVLRFAVGFTTITRALESGADPVDAAAAVANSAVEVLNELLPDCVRS